MEQEGAAQKNFLTQSEFSTFLLRFFKPTEEEENFFFLSVAMDREALLKCIMVNIYVF